MLRIDINCDMGESFGRWRLGDDVGMMPYITSANIATGYHAGDPPTIRRTVAAAVDHGLGIGAHLALPDLMGFGRRRMQVRADELEDYCLYQLGALQVFVDAAGGRLTHVKPHGALYVMASESDELSAAVARAVATVNPALPLLLLNRRTADSAGAQGVAVITEAFPDLHYDRHGGLVIEQVKLAWDPRLVADRAVRMVAERKVTADDGSDLDVDPVSLCLHGDAPNGVEVAAEVHRQLLLRDVELVPLDRLRDSPRQPAATAGEPR